MCNDLDPEIIICITIFDNYRMVRRNQKKKRNPERQRAHASQPDEVYVGRSTTPGWEDAPYKADMRVGSDS